LLYLIVAYGANLALKNNEVVYPVFDRLSVSYQISVKFTPSIAEGSPYLCWQTRQTLDGR